MKLIYLAQPYTSPDHDVQEARFEEAKIATAKLVDRGSVYSPIVHGHVMVLPLAREGRDTTSHNFWMRQCIPILRKSDEMIVLPLLGWRHSRGLREELNLCKMLHIPVRFLTPKTITADHYSRFDFPEVAEAESHSWEFLYV